MAVLTRVLPPTWLIQREIARRELLAFTTYTFPGYQTNWHHALLAKTLDRWAFGDIKRLMVFMPPRCGKSEQVSRRLPAYIFGRNPDAEVIATSYSADLAEKMNRDVQRIMNSDEYAELFPDVRLPRPRSHEGTATVERFDIVGGRGSYRAAGLGGGITGMGATHAIIDDPVKNREQAYSPTLRELAWEWYVSTLFSRLEKDGRVLLTMTRWHHDDLAGRLVEYAKSSPEPWHIICLPMRFEETALTHPDDPRAVGDPLWPGKFDDAAVQEIEQLATAGGTWSALYQQRPSRDSGAIFQSTGHRWYTAEGVGSGHTYVLRKKITGDLTVTEERLPAEFLRRFYTVDLAVSLKQSADYTCIGCWGITPQNDLLLEHIERVRIEGPDQIPLIASLMERYPPRIIGIERTQYQLSLVQAARRLGWPVQELTPKGDKVSRALPAATRWNTGHIYLPLGAPWADIVARELLTFPAGTNDDVVDVFAYAAEMLLGIGNDTGSLAASVAGLTRTNSWRTQ